MKSKESKLEVLVIGIVWALYALIHYLLIASTIWSFDLTKLNPRAAIIQTFIFIVMSIIIVTGVKDEVDNKLIEKEE